MNATFRTKVLFKGINFSWNNIYHEKIYFKKYLVLRVSKSLYLTWIGRGLLLPALFETLVPSDPNMKQDCHISVCLHIFHLYAASAPVTINTPQLEIINGYKTLVISILGDKWFHPPWTLTSLYLHSTAFLARPLTTTLQKQLFFNLRTICM